MLKISHRLGLAAIALQCALPVAAVPSCEADTWLVTGYVRTSPDFNQLTADGTDIFTEESIVAAPQWVPMGSVVDIDGLGEFRVADRGGALGLRHLDVAVWSRREAYELTGCYFVTIIRWGYPPVE